MDEDFEPDRDGLQRALDQLIELRGAPGLPAPCDHSGQWPEQGIGPVSALDQLAGPALAGAARLDHPGFLAHMDPPTPWVTWAAAMWAACVNGTVATGAVDPLDAGHTAAWRHVDAAWAGALCFSPHYAQRLAGVQAADSVALSCHKWLYQPKESAAIFFRDAERAHAALSFGGGYLAAPNVGILGSHGASALPLMATLLAWGRRGLAQRIERGMAIAERLARLVEDAPELKLWGEPATGIVFWRPRRGDPEAMRGQLGDAWASIVEVDGDRWLRSVAANPQARPELLVKRVREAIGAA